MDYSTYPEGFSKIAQSFSFLPEAEREDFLAGFIFTLMTESME